MGSMVSSASLFKDPGAPYYIYAPAYIETSSGIQVLHYLCHALNLIGRNAYICGTKVINRNLKTPALDSEMIDFHRKSGCLPIAVYPEVVSGNPLSCDVVVRYILNKIGFIGGNDLDAEKDDLFFYYDASFRNDEDPFMGYLGVPVTDISVFCVPSEQVIRSGSYLYLNRYSRDKVDYSLLPDDLKIISTENPLDLKSLAELFKKIEVLYSYEYSNTCSLAILCGCPVIYMPGGLGYDNLERHDLAKKRAGWRFYNDKDGWSIDQDQINAVRDYFVQHEKKFWKELEGFVDKTQHAAKMALKKRNSVWSVPDWVVDRAPNPGRVLALQAMIDANPSVGDLGVFIRISNTCDDKTVFQTLESLRKQLRPITDIWLVGERAPKFAYEENVRTLPWIKSWQRTIGAYIEQNKVPDFVWLLDAGDQLLPHASLVFGEYRLRNQNPLLWYTDEALLRDGIPTRPMLKPDFNIDLLRSYPYVGRNLILSTAAIQVAGGLDDRLGDLAPIDLLWRMVEQVGPGVVGHIPEVLIYGACSLFDWTCAPEILTWFPPATQAHLVRLGLDAQVLPGPALGVSRVEYSLPSQPLVSIIVPTRDHFTILRDFVEGLMEKTAYSNYELLIVDNDSVESDAVGFLANLEKMTIDQVRVLRWQKDFDFAAINNFAVSKSRGEVLLFLNNDIIFTKDTKPDWLERLLRHVLRPEIGMVGTRLDLPRGQVDQYGQVLGLDNGIGSAFRGIDSEKQGYMYRLVVQQNVSALSASCLMMRREVFQELGGFDAQSFPIYYADTDLSLRATQAGYLLALEPDLGLQHMGGASRLLTERFGLAARPDDEQLDRLYARWLPQLARDPNYHPAFGRFSPGFNLSQDASRIHDPLPGRPLPVVLAAHGDWQGCGHYRILHPFQAMRDELRLEGGLKHRDFHFMDVARIQPDVIILQGGWNNKSILKQIQRYREITGAKVVLEFDDYMPNIPTRSVYRKKISQGIIKEMRRAIEQVDWLVVSTSTLAQEYSGFHDDIRIAMNGLLPAWWGALQGQRRIGKKMRVGWAGGSSHSGDLAEIRSVVKELEDEVEWVFMGMKPEGINCQFHPGASIDRYPAELAALGLDLAVVPLEMNQFNRCKSNLRLLELGACGIPVICTDINPYQGDLPVIRVRNRHQDWVQAIREHLSNPEALARRGDVLREAVLQDWMLQGTFLDQWAKAWGVAPVTI